jgi:hypothetical protein
MLALKDHQKQNKFPTAEYVPKSQIEKAKAENPAIDVKLGQKSVLIYFSELNQKTNEYENQSAELFNVAQVTKPQLLKDWIISKYMEKIATQYSESVPVAEQRQERKYTGTGPTVTCNSSEPKEYIGQYLAAVSMDGKFKVSPELAKEFVEKTQTAMAVEMKNGKPNPFNFSKICNEANDHCKIVIPDVMKEVAKEQKQEQKQEIKHQQSRSR